MQPVKAYTGVVDDKYERRGGVATPSELIRVAVFLNTLDERRFTVRGRRQAGGDLLATPTALTAWLTAYGLLGPDEPVDGESFALALSLRAALRGALAVGAGQAPDSPKFASLPLLPLQLDLHPKGTAGLRPVEAGARGAIAALAADVAVASAGGTWQRLKMCGSADCRWIFYDGSRNGLGRWCAMDVCGNRAKTRAYRERRAAHPPALV
jgi:hypothetical protein